MTLFEPTLIVSRLVVLRGEHTAYDEQFHTGVNVIRGENSSGKSTILNCIYYALGGDLDDWSETALLCTKVFAEVFFNNIPATLSREISSELGQPMEIYGGTYENSQSAPRSEWKRFPYRRSQNRQSFSQAIFQLLKLPEVAGEASGNLTVHQLLRLLYADQLSPVERLFRYDPRYDSPYLREAVGRLLCGAYENKVYQNELSIRSLSREFDDASAELRSLLAIVGRRDQKLDMESVEARRTSLLKEQSDLNHQIEDAEKALYLRADVDALTLESQEGAYRRLQSIQAELSDIRKKKDNVLLSEADSAIFIQTLESKIAALSDASMVASNFEEVIFEICPSCFADLSSHKDGKVCHLCKTPFDEQRVADQIASMINDASVQITQSRLLQERRREQISDLDTSLSRALSSWRSASKELESLQRLPSSEARDQVRGLNQRAGYLVREIEDLDSQIELVHLVRAASSRKDELNAAITKLRSENEQLRFSQEKQFAAALTLISDEVRTLLKNDLRRQDSFENPQGIEFDFATNSITVDNHTYFSASSRVILKSSFFLGFLSAATKSKRFRHPRFVMIDTIEDKGMEPERSHNFQNQILRVSNGAPALHQIIYATAMISPDLDDEEYTIGRFYTRDEPTLEIA